MQEIAEGKRIVASYYEIRKDFWDTMERYDTNTVCAHNAGFDYRATNTTQRWLTKSKYRYFLPYGTEVWDTMKMARDVISHTPSYVKFCEENGFMTKHKTPRPRLTAEILYRYITGNMDFEESHTGLEDVDIERQIMAYCFSKHKAMAKGAWEKSHYKKVEAVN
jgi:DNA polymerase III epsilon subunit-like protein